MDQVKNKEENTSGGVPTTGSDINYCPENCVPAPQASLRAFHTSILYLL